MHFSVTSDVHSTVEKLPPGKPKLGLKGRKMIFVFFYNPLALQKSLGIMEISITLATLTNCLRACARIGLLVDIITRNPTRAR